MIRRFLRWLSTPILKGLPDPVTGCGLYRAEGCAPVDGMLCDYLDCSMLHEWEAQQCPPKP
jgi:hypothetical protein